MKRITTILLTIILSSCANLIITQEAKEQREYWNNHSSVNEWVHIDSLDSGISTTYYLDIQHRDTHKPCGRHFTFPALDSIQTETIDKRRTKLIKWKNASWHYEIKRVYPKYRYKIGRVTEYDSLDNKNGIEAFYKQKLNGGMVLKKYNFFTHGVLDSTVHYDKNLYVKRVRYGNR